MEDARLFEAEVECNQQPQLQNESIKPLEVVSVPFVCEHKPLATTLDQHDNNVLHESIITVHHAVIKVVDFGNSESLFVLSLCD